MSVDGKRRCLLPNGTEINELQFAIMSHWPHNVVIGRLGDTLPSRWTRARFGAFRPKLRPGALKTCSGDFL
jgi:hypothetical protein